MRRWAERETLDPHAQTACVLLATAQARCLGASTLQGKPSSRTHCLLQRTLMHASCPSQPAPPTKTSNMSCHQLPQRRSAGLYGSLLQGTRRAAAQKVLHMVTELVPRLVPSLTLKARTELLPLLQLLVCCHPSQEARKQMLGVLVNLLPSPDLQQRQVSTAEGCILLRACCMGGLWPGPLRHATPVLPTVITVIIFGSRGTCQVHELGHNPPAARYDHTWGHDRSIVF